MWGERILTLVLSLFLFSLFSGVLFAIGWSLFIMDTDVFRILRWIFLPLLALLWFALAVAFGIIPRWLIDAVKKRFSKSHRRWDGWREENRRQVAEPDFAAAERLHGRLPADVLALYRSPRRLERDVIFGDADDDDTDMHVAEFLAIDVEMPVGGWLPRGPWITIAGDAFGNYYLAHLEKSEGDRTPIYFFDHDGGEPDPYPIDFDVADLVDGPMRKLADEAEEAP